MEMHHAISRFHCNNIEIASWYNCSAHSKLWPTECSFERIAILGYAVGLCRHA